MAVKIIHTADVHLDSVFSGRLGPDRAKRKREAVRTAFKRIIDDCLGWPADMLVIAGDLFEEERVTPDTIGFLRMQFARLKSIPVVIAPGNHDPFTVTGRYAVTDWGPNVRIFTRGSVQKISLPSIGVDVHGVAHVSTHMSGRFTEIVQPVKSDGALPLLVIHASDETAVPADQASDDIWLPFRRDELARLGYAYMALGHYHVSYDIPAGDRVIAAYPGSPEGLRASESGKRHYARVTVDRDGARVERVPLAGIGYDDFSVACDSFASREEFYEAVRALDVESPGSTIARVRATGRVTPGFSLPADLPEDIYSRFFYIALDNETVPAYDWDALAEEKTLRGEVVRRFATELSAADPERARVLEQARLYAIDAIEGRAVESPAEVRRVD